MNKSCGECWYLKWYIFYPVFLIFASFIVLPLALLIAGLANNNQMQIVIGGIFLFIEIAYSMTLDRNGFKKSDIKKWKKEFYDNK